MINFNKIKYHSSYGVSRQLPNSDIPEIVFVGKSNVGKSSLLNKLTNNKKLAKVSSTPGKTTTINFFEAQDSFFVDLPGYGFAKRSKNEKNRWEELIEGYFEQNRNIPLVIILIDIRHEPTNLDLQMIEYVKQCGYPYIIVCTKADKLSKQKIKNCVNKLKKNIKESEHINILAVSSINGHNILELKNIIELVLQ